MALAVRNTIHDTIAMIIATLLALLFTILNIAFFFVDPVLELPFGMEAALAQIYGLVHAGTTIFPPLAYALTFLILGITTELGYQGYQVVMRIIKLIRGSG